MFALMVMVVSVLEPQANGFKLNVEGSVFIGAGYTIYGDGSGITNQDSIWKWPKDGL